MKLYVVFVLFIAGFVGICRAQTDNIVKQFTLSEVITVAHDQSPDAMIAKHNFRAYYWQFRSYQAKLLPSLNLNGLLGNFNRSLMPLQNSETGAINYVSNHTLRNSMSLSIDQNIALTGGSLSLYTNLDRLDQYEPTRSTTYNSQPINITYIQPLRAFNSLKWEKKIEPKEYDRAKRDFLEAMENITIKSTELYFGMWVAKCNLELAKTNYTNTEKLLVIAKQRFEIGSVTKSELMQLELRMLNDGLSINKYQLEYNKAQFGLRSFLGYNDLVEIVPDYREQLPLIMLDSRMVLNLAYRNSSFTLQQELQLLAAQRDVAEAKASNGLKASLQGQFGLTQQGSTLRNSYRNPMDQEIVSLGLSLPIMDWGQSRGRIKMAQSREEVIRTETDRAEADFRQNIVISVMQFNNQQRQCQISAKADSIAQERYRLTSERFANGSIGVTDLNMAQTEKDEAVNRYISELRSFWIYYYNIRKLTLYDYITETNISTEFDKIIENK